MHAATEKPLMFVFSEAENWGGGGRVCFFLIEESSCEFSPYVHESVSVCLQYLFLLHSMSHSEEKIHQQHSKKCCQKSWRLNVMK